MKLTIRPILSLSLAVLMMAPTIVIAQNSSAAAKQPSLVEMVVQMLPMIAMMFVIFYVLVSRPQQKKFEEHEKLLKSLNKGDEVVTTGGLIAKVALVEESQVTLEVAAGVKVRFQKTAIVSRT